MGGGSSKDAPVPRKFRSCCGSRARKGRRSIKDRFFGSSCLRPLRISSQDENEGKCSKMKSKLYTDEFGRDVLKNSDSVKEDPHANLALNNISCEHNRESVPLSALHSNHNSARENDMASNSSFRFRTNFGFFQNRTVFQLGRSGSQVASGTSPLTRSLSVPCAEGIDNVHLVVGASSDNTYESVPGEASATDAVGSITDSIGGASHPQINIALSDVLGVRHSQRLSQEQLDDTVQLSRSRSAGRLRHRVLRRASLSERFGVFTSADETQEYVGLDNRMPQVSAREDVSSTNGNIGTPMASLNRLSSISRLSRNNQGPISEATVLREPGGQDGLDHRLAFLERRRRIRSQVRALQRLGSRLDNLSGHDRSCILAGQHRSGRCSCRSSTRSNSASDDTSARASVSRIVMLAEALFEVLDEIHQQAVVLASQSSSSSTGAVPAPEEVVEGMPVKMFSKSLLCQADEVAQCYICLVEYEEGDCMRILPCCHEFHQACVDKWLKEIHRVCPLCRGDVCISDGSPVDECEL